MKLYHGATSKNLEDILRRGIRPRTSSMPSTWPDVPSDAEMVYLTTTYPFSFAANTVADDEHPQLLVFELDLARLNERRLYPDEEWLSAAIEAEHELPHEAAHALARQSLKRNRRLWRESL
jgi:hypothetical protein